MEIKKSPNVERSRYLPLGALRTHSKKQNNTLIGVTKDIPKTGSALVTTFLETVYFFQSS